MQLAFAGTTTMRRVPPASANLIQCAASHRHLISAAAGHDQYSRVSGGGTSSGSEKEHVSSSITAALYPAEGIIASPVGVSIGTHA